MFKSLKNHPFAVEAYFDSSIVFTFAVPKEKLENLLCGEVIILIQLGHLLTY